MSDMPELTRCPDCQGWFDADDMTGGRCPNCAGPEPVDPWEGQVVPGDEHRAVCRALSDANAALLEVEAERDQARRFAVAWQGAAEAYREVVEALTHEYRPFVYDSALAAAVGRVDSGTCQASSGIDHEKCLGGPDHPVHRTVAVIEAELQPDDTPDFDPGQVPASTGEQQR